MEVQNQSGTKPEYNSTQQATKFCKHCGGKIAEKAVVCPICGCQVEELNVSNSTYNPQPIVINNTNTNTVVSSCGRARNKWVAFVLCLFLGFVGAHKFYEGKIGMGVLYIFTGAVFGIGWIIDLISIIFKPTVYYV